MQREFAESEKATDDALERLTEMSKRMKLLEREAPVLRSQLSKLKKARNVAVLRLDG